MGTKKPLAPFSMLMNDFRAPKINPIVMSACHFIFPLWVKLNEQLKVHIFGGQSDLQCFSEAKHALILANHPDRQDPFAIAALSGHMKEDFYTICAREVFDWDFGLRGWLLQSVGSYSVKRGKPDRHSIATTKKLLKKGDHKVVIFPEGEITGDQDSLEAFPKSIFHIVLDAQKDLKAEGSSEPVYVIPCAIQYSLETDPETALGPCLSKLGKKLDLNFEDGADVIGKTKQIIKAYLTELSYAYSLVLEESSSAQMAEQAAIEMLKRVGAICDFEYDDSISPKDQLYAIRNATDEKFKKLPSLARQCRFHCGGISQPSIRGDLERIERLLILNRSLLHFEDDIQACRSLDFIESELCGRVSPKGWQKCSVYIEEPIDVSAFSELYEQNKEDAVDKLCNLFTHRLNAGIKCSRKIAILQSDDLAIAS